MNREQRRKGGKIGEAINHLQSPCNITEAVQIARGVAEDVVADYQNRTRHLQVSTSLQIELLKDIVISAGLITEEQFRDKYIEQVEAFNKMQQEAFSKSESSGREGEDNYEKEENPTMSHKVSDIEIEKSTKEA